MRKPRLTEGSNLAKLGLNQGCLMAKAWYLPTFRSFLPLSPSLPPGLHTLIPVPLAQQLWSICYQLPLPRPAPTWAPGSCQPLNSSPCPLTCLPDFPEGQFLGKPQPQTQELLPGHHGLKRRINSPSFRSLCLRREETLALSW